MAFDYEGAKREGYSDAEIAEHLSKKSGFKLDAARKEGYADADIIKHLASKEDKSKSVISGEKGSWTYNAQALPGAAESLLRGVAGVAGQIGGGFTGAVGGALSLENPFVTGAKKAEEWGKAAESIPRVFATTEDIEKDILGPTMDWAKQKVGEGAEQAAKTGSTPFPPMAIIEAARRQMMTKEEQMKQEAAARSVGEAGFDVYGVAMAGAPSRPRVRKDTGIREVPPTPEPSPQQGPKQYTYQPDLFTEDARVRGAAEIDSRRQAAMGELETMAEQKAFLDKELSGQRDLFSEPVIRDQVDTGLDTRPDRLPLKPVELTPDQLQRAQEGLVHKTRDETQYDRLSENELRNAAPEATSMSEIISRDTTGREIRHSLNQMEDVPAVSFEPNRPFVGREDFAATTGWQRADARVAEAIAGDSYLKGICPWIVSPFS